MATYGNFMLPSVLCYEDKVVRKATNYLGIFVSEYSIITFDL